MSNAQMSARVGLFFIIGVALIWVTFESLSRGRISRDKGYTLVAYFTNLKELKQGDEVRMAGVKIGSVQQTQLKGRRAQAVLLINPAVQVAKDAKAQIAMAGLLGSNYLSLDMGTEAAGFLEPGAEIKAVDTPDLNALVSQLGDIGKKVDDALGGLSKSMGGKDGGGLLGKIDKMVDDNSGKIDKITTNLQEITDKVNKGEGTLGKLVNDPKLHDELLATVGEIKGAANEAKLFVTNAQSIVEQVKSGQGTLGVLIYDKEAGANIKTTTKNLKEITDKLNNGQGTLGKLISDDTLFNQAQGAVKKLDRALDSLEDQGPITAVGAAAGSLF